MATASTSASKALPVGFRRPVLRLIRSTLSSTGNPYLNLDFLGRAPTFQDVANDWYTFAGGQGTNAAAW